MIWLTAAIAFFALCSVIVAILQWRAMKGQWDAMEQQLAEMRSGSADTRKLAEAASRQAAATETTASAAGMAVDVASKQLVVSQRPWVKITHKIIGPLTFDVGGRQSGKSVALMTVEDTLENVGQTVAVNVLHWEDVIPMDVDPHGIPLTTGPTRRLKEWCDANRHPSKQGLAGGALFPHDPQVSISTIGPTMDAVASAGVKTGTLAGRVGFMLVGCVVYRFAFEAESMPTHQTRFAYMLGVPAQEGAFNVFVSPIGVARDLRVVEIPNGPKID